MDNPQIDSRGSVGFHAWRLFLSLVPSQPILGGERLITISTSAQNAVSRLIALQARVDNSAPDSVDAVVGALHLTTIELSRWLGPDGTNALLLRALNRARRGHAVLADIKVVTNSAPNLAGIDDRVAVAGAAPVTAGLTATLLELFELLVRMVGDDLTTKLADQITAQDATQVVADTGEESA